MRLNANVLLVQMIPNGGSMTDTKAHPDERHRTAIARLSDELKISAQQVGAVYAEEFDRLAGGARISTFLDILALNNTRSKLRQAHRRVASS